VVCQAVVPDAPTNVGGLMPGGDRSVGRGKGGLKALNTLSLPFRIIPTCEHVENIVYRFGYRPIPTSCTDRIYRSANLSCGGVAVVRGALGCCYGWRVLLSSLRGRRCGHLATGRGTVARPRLVCPHKRSDPVVRPSSLRSGRVSDRPASAFGHTPPHERYVTHFNDPGSGAEMARGRPLPRGTIFHPWVAVETKI